MSDPKWPARPAGVMNLSYAERESVFGKFDWQVSPDDPKEIEILGDWESKNIVKVEFAEFNRKVRFHRLIAAQFSAFLEHLRSEKLIGAIKTWDGSFSPRFVRGSKKNLSNHSWATAFDVNYEWNELGEVPTLQGEKGSVRELVLIAVEHGLYWGGWGFGNDEAYTGRLDGMHFEFFKVIP
jgi:hypothetical protein